jgi:hypothetical protein
VTTWQSVFVLDLASRLIYHLHRGSGSYFGATWCQDFLYVAARFGYNDVVESSVEKILKFDKRLKFVGYVEGANEKRMGLHSMQFDPEHNKLWVTATAKNKIKIVNVKTGEIEIFHPNPQKTNTDWNHFNAATINGQYMMINAHNGRNNIPYGQVYFCRRKKPYQTEFVVPMLKSSQSHECFVLNNELHTCASEQGQITNYKGRGVLPKKWKGYTRGIVITPKTLFVGESKRAERFYRKDVDGWIHIYRRRGRRFVFNKSLHFPKVGQILAIRALDRRDFHHNLPPFLKPRTKIHLPADRMLHEQDKRDSKED